MTGARLGFTLDDNAFVEGLTRARNLAVNNTPIMAAIGVAMVRSTEDRMDGPTDAKGNPWAPLNPAYAEIKRGPGILRESLKLQKSLTFFASTGAVVWGSNRVYAAAQQFGATIKPTTAKALVFRLGGGGGVVRLKSVTLPPRPYLGIDAADGVTIVEVAERALGFALFGRAV